MASRANPAAAALVERSAVSAVLATRAKPVALCYVFSMSEHTILITAKGVGPKAEYIEQLQREARVVVGNTPEAFVQAAQEATVMLNWSAPRDLNRSVFLMAPQLAWVHSRNAGLDAFLFPELVESPVILTNGSGVFSRLSASSRWRRCSISRRTSAV